MDDLSAGQACAARVMLVLAWAIADLIGRLVSCCSCIQGGRDIGIAASHDLLTE